MEGFEGQRSIQAWTEIPPEDAPRAAKALYTRLAAKGWDMTVYHAVTLHQPELYAGSTDTHAAGEVKTPRHVQDHWALGGYRWHEGSSVARLLATWDKRRIEGKPVLLDCAHTWDVATGLWWVKTATELEEWVSMFAPKPPPKRKAQPAPEASSLDAEIASGVWHG